MHLFLIARTSTGLSDIFSMLKFDVVIMGIFKRKRVEIDEIKFALALSLSLSLSVFKVDRSLSSLSLSLSYRSIDENVSKSTQFVFTNACPSVP